jgi:hypothetical protein
VNSRGKTELADDVHTAIYGIREPFMQRRKKIGQNSLTPYRMVFIMQDIERVRKLKLPATRRVLPGNAGMIAGSVLTPVLESLTALPSGHPADLPVIP